MEPPASHTKPDRKPPPTLEDLGKILGLSKRAVSQALHDRTGTVKVSAATRERVRALAKTLGYRKNMAAAALTTRRTGMFGILTSVGRMHVSAMQLAAAVDEFRSLGISPLVIHDAARSAAEYDFSLDTLINSRVDGVLLLHRPPHFGEAHVEKLRDYGMSIVQIGSTSPAHNISHYLTDRRQAFGLVVDHVLSQGYRRLGTITRNQDQYPHPTWQASGIQTHVAILEAVNQARNAGADISLEIYNAAGRGEEYPDVHLLYAPGYAVTRDLIAKGSLPEVLICQVDGWALGAMRACGEAGIRIPEDMAITGYGNEPSGSATLVPLTSITEPFEEMCRAAITELVSAVKEGRATHRQPVVMPCELIVRRSSLRSGAEL